MENRLNIHISIGGSGPTLRTCPHNLFTPARISLGCCDITMRLFSLRLNITFFYRKVSAATSLAKVGLFRMVTGWLRRCSVCRTFFSCKKGIRVVRVPSCFSMLGRIIGAFCRDLISSSCCSDWRWSSCASSCSCR